jgi:uncharacterized sodium:solute symporter family permease YidK
MQNDKSMTLTGVVMVIAVCSLMLYDLLAYVFGGEASTISRFLEGSFDKYPAILLGVAYILGHIISPMKCKKCIERETNDSSRHIENT